MNRFRQLSGTLAGVAAIIPLVGP